MFQVEEAASVPSRPFSFDQFCKHPKTCLFVSEDTDLGWKQL